MLSFWPERMVVVAKHSVLYIPFLGVVFWLLGNIVLDRKKHDKSIEAMTKAADEVLTCLIELNFRLTQCADSQ